MNVSLVFTELEVFGVRSINEMQFSTLEYKLACGVTKTDRNLAYLAPAYLSSALYNIPPSLLTDGLKGEDGATYTNFKGAHWAVVDLGSVSSIEFVRVWANSRTSIHINGFEVAVGNTFKTCSPHTTVLLYKPCAVINVTKEQEIVELDCVATGRYVAIRSSIPRTQAMSLTEIEVFGTRMSTADNSSSKEDYHSRCEVTATEENIAYEKPVKTSDNERPNRYVTDGKLSSTFTSEPSSHPWIVVDLKSVKKVHYIRVWINTDHHKAPYVELLVGKQFLPCEAHKLDTFTQCKVFQTPSTIHLVESSCVSSVEGQFVLLRYGSHKELLENASVISIKEMEVFGSDGDSPSTPMAVPGLDFTVNTEELALHTRVRRAILEGVSAVEIPIYSSPLYFGQPNSFSIIYKKDSHESYMVATLLGAGRLITMGSNTHVAMLRQGNPASTLWSNMLAWLRNDGALSGQVVNIQKGYDSGDIVVVSDITSVNSSQMQSLIENLKEGKIGVIHSVAGWVLESTSYKSSPQYTLNQASGVYFSRHVLTWSKETWKMQSLDDLSTIGVVTTLAHSTTQPGLLAARAKTLRHLLDFPYEVVKSFQMEDLLSGIAAKYSDFVSYHQPCEANPLKDKQIQSFIMAYNYLLLVPLYANTSLKAPGVTTFPGEVEDSSRRVTKKLSISSRWVEDHPTGIYIPPGETVSFTVNSIMNSTLDDWMFRIGCTTDNIGQLSEWKRFPLVSSVSALSSNVLHSPFGGILLLHSNKQNTSISITFHNVVEAPFFNLRDADNMKNYDTRRLSPAPWSDIAGDSIILCLPSKLLRQYSSDQVNALMMNVWDKVVQWDTDLLDQDYHLHRRHRVAMDVQVGYGTAHSGYPIVVPFEWIHGIMNMSDIFTHGSWGMFHELGHNHQLEPWNFRGVTETTVNIFTMFNYESLLNISMFVSRDSFYTDPNYRGPLKDHLDKGATFDSFSSPYIGLAFYYQLKHCFGWGLYKRVFSQYRILRIQPATDQDKMDEWLYQVSNVTGVNLKPIFDFWGVPVTEKAAARVSKWPCVLPSKELSFNSSRWDLFNQQYKHQCTATCFEIPYPAAQPMDVLSPNDVYEENVEMAP